MHLLERDGQGWLSVTPQFLNAYYMRPEMAPIAGSCKEEVSLHVALMADPFRPVTEAELAAIADREAADNYRHVLAYRDLLMGAGTVEGAYLRLMRQSGPAIPPLFIDQMVHLIMHNILKECTDPMRLRTAELFFREQSAATEDGRLMLADEEVVAINAFLMRNSDPARRAAQPERVALDVLSEDNKEAYWSRSDRFDTVIDFRFGTPAPDALARVIEAWLLHLAGLKVHIEPKAQISDPDWRWHIGLDREASRILDALFAGRQLSQDEAARIAGLFLMRIRDDDAVLDAVKGKPIYLALAIDARRRLKMKPQNLLMNLPLKDCCAPHRLPEQRI